jgi:hypothetical protein
LIAGLLIVAYQKFDAEGILYTWALLPVPWIWMVGWLPLGGYLAIVLNATTLYALVALGIAAWQKFLGLPE